MSYCLNPDCKKPQNLDGTKFCQSCGTKLLLGDRYRAIKPIGQGGFGRTFLAVDEYKPSQPRCAIKQFFPQGAGSQKAAELFQQEAVRLDDLGKHPQIPELLAHFDQDGRQYLVQEFIDGQNLDEELDRNGCFSEARIEQLLQEILPVLQFIHEGKVIHRDVKPENIIRRHSDGKLFLVDFGAAKFATTSGLLKTGTAIGSAGYVAPEQAVGRAAFASDLYSLGVTCIHLLTQTGPFELYSASEGDWVWRNYLQHSVSDRLAAILDKMLESGTNQRYKTAAEVLNDLNADSSSLSETDIPIAPTRILSNVSQLEPTVPTIVVGKFGSADYQSISEAVKNAQPGTRILVRPGFYLESLVIDKPLEILGDGAVGDIKIVSQGAFCIRMQTENAVVRGFSLANEADRRGKKHSTVKILTGSLILQDCDITSDSGSCISIHTTMANPVIQRCKIHDGKHSGIWITENGRGIIEDCDIFGNTYPEIVIDKGGNPTIRRCRIHDGKGNGIRVTENGRGIVEDCDIFGSTYPQIVIDKSGNPTIRRCKIHDGKGNGVCVVKDGQGIVEDCDIFANADSGVYVDKGGNPTIRRCKIERNVWGVYVKSNGTGTFENCDLTGNQRGAWQLEMGSSVRRSDNNDKDGMGKLIKRVLGLN
jgi:parallel beta-helix repeat protein